MRIAVIGAGPAGIYAADILASRDENASIDVIERLPAPYGLVRYGVAPDHPRIKEIIVALQRVLANPRIRFIGNVEYGMDISLDDLRTLYDAVVFATGAMADRSLDIPGADLPGSFGAADFVSWYDAHPDVSRDWDLSATHVAVIGAGNVALDITRMLAKPVDEQLSTEIPAHVRDGLARNRATDVHVFARRGPAQLKFTPLELRELAHSPSVDVVVHPEGFELDAASELAVQKSRQTKQVVNTLLQWINNPPGTKAHRIHLHFCEEPVAILGDGRVAGLRTERTELIGDGTVRRTGLQQDWTVQAVYRAIGYRSDALPGVPFDPVTHVIPHQAGRVLGADGSPLPAVYATGWIKRGPVGLIGHTKSDAAETVESLLADHAASSSSVTAGPDAVLELLRSRGVDYTDTDGWLRLDAHEKALGAAEGRARIKVAGREEMVDLSRGSGLPLAEAPTA